jgi:hypothetical protein
LCYNRIYNGELTPHIPLLRYEAGMPHAEISRLATLAIRAAARYPDEAAVFQDALKEAIAGKADPYVLIGLMVAGITATIAGRIPSVCQSDVSRATEQLLRDEMTAKGVL